MQSCRQYIYQCTCCICLQGGGGAKEVDAYTGPLIGKVDIRVGKIVKVRPVPVTGFGLPRSVRSRQLRSRPNDSFVRPQAWPHPDSEKLWCEEVDIGEASTILAVTFLLAEPMRISRLCTHSSFASLWPKLCAGQSAPNRLWTTQALHPGAAPIETIDHTIVNIIGACLSHTVHQQTRRMRCRGVLP